MTNESFKIVQYISTCTYARDGQLLSWSNLLANSESHQTLTLQSSTVSSVTFTICFASKSETEDQGHPPNLCQVSRWQVDCQYTTAHYPGWILSGNLSAQWSSLIHTSGGWKKCFSCCSQMTWTVWKSAKKWTPSSAWELSSKKWNSYSAWWRPSASLLPLLDECLSAFWRKNQLPIELPKDVNEGGVMWTRAEVMWMRAEMMQRRCKLTPITAPHHCLSCCYFLPLSLQSALSPTHPHQYPFQFYLSIILLM